MSQPLVPDDPWPAIEPLLPTESPQPTDGRPRIPDDGTLGSIFAMFWIGFLWRFLPHKRRGGSRDDVLVSGARRRGRRRQRLMMMWHYLLALAASPERFRDGHGNRPVPSLSRPYLLDFVICLKFLVPSLMLRFPAVGAWGNYVVDSIDGDVLLELGLSEETYQTIDKAADFFSYLIMLIIGLRWRIKTLIVLLFMYRTIGQLLFFKTRKEIVFVAFPNFLEPLVLAYTFLLWRAKGSEDQAYASYRKHLGLIWTLIIAYKLWNEWYLHYANIDLSSRVFGFTGGTQLRGQPPRRS